MLKDIHPWNPIDLIKQLNGIVLTIMLQNHSGVVCQFGLAI